MKIRFELNPAILNLKESSTLAINQMAKGLRNQGKTIYHYGFGQSPFPVHHKIQEELKANAHNKEYLPTAGLPELRQAISDYLKREMDQEFDPNLILIGPGSKELIFQTLFVLEGPVLIPAPSWVSYKPQVDIKREGNTQIIQTSAENNYKLQPEELQAHCDRFPASQRIMILNNPNNPTGAFYRKDEIKKLAKVFRKNNIIVISDEIYAPIIFSNEKYVGLHEFYPEATIVTGGLSKVFSAGGYRLGFMALPDSMMDAYRPLTAMFSETFSSVSSPVQFAAVKAYSEDSDIKEYVQRCTSIHKAAGEYLHKRFTAMGVHCSTPEGSFYVLVDFEYHREKLAVLSSVELCNLLLKEASIAVLPGTDFYMPSHSLTARVATVDYNGTQVYEAAIAEEVNESFIEKHCPNLKEGMDSLEKFLTSL